MRLDPDVLALAEDLNVNLPPSEGSERVVTDRYAVWLGPEDHPALTVVQRLRLTTEQVEPTLDEVRALLRARGRTGATWEVGDSATPADLAVRLERLGLTPWEEPLAAGMVLAEPPDWEVPDVEVRIVSSLDDQLEADRILNEGFGAPLDPAAERERAERAMAARAAGRAATFLALLDGRPVAAATAVFTPAALVLGGAVTREAARRRGAYRALIAARFEAARAAGTSTLVVQAGPLSRPILRRLGFREVVEIRILHDRL